MYYSLIGILAFLILIITNHDVLFKKKDTVVSPVQKKYFWFLTAVIYYYVTDIFWGVFESLSMTRLLYIDTEIYFVAMAMGILFWTQYVIAYLEDKNIFSKLLAYAGALFFLGVVLLVVLNLFIPLMFWFDEAGAYHAGTARNVVLLVQVLILLLTSIYALRTSARTKDAEKKRYFTIGLFGLIMLALIAIQFFEPYLPLYAIGYMLGCSLLRTFVTENEKEEYRHNLEIALAREKKELMELNAAWVLAYTDSLTGVKSKLAYAEKEDQLDNMINSDSSVDLAIAVFDVNGLKHINDTIGHDAGDRFIIRACRLICHTFKHSPVFRIGGDEFAVVLEGQDFENRNQLMALFNQKIEENQKNNDVVIAAGIADYEPHRDNSCKRIFERADFRMYQRKDELKHQLPDNP